MKGVIITAVAGGESVDSACGASGLSGRRSRRCPRRGSGLSSSFRFGTLRIQNLDLLACTAEKCNFESGRVQLHEAV